MISYSIVLSWIMSYPILSYNIITFEIPSWCTVLPYHEIEKEISSSLMWIWSHHCNYDRHHRNYNAMQYNFQYSVLLFLSLPLLIFLLTSSPFSSLSSNWISTYLFSSYLLPSYLILSHLISSHLFLSNVSSSHLRSSHPSIKNAPL